MGVKQQKEITRRQALNILLEEIPQLPNEALGDLMDTLADSDSSTVVAWCGNFIVSDVT